ncbi:GNAT family N-acetyltransferase [Actinoplanes auranticolor]|uniref:GCN5 family N-acetyltransferase n=1 Tax=Actinoplanes auranticolor TaxID=47988 RepID=A0A919S4B3_9ACTN|nr:GNAT family N-acetyltransferase [Actinoplanes auranticolor]GIM63089.1 GCN5 family N-acetyltransferase [Actinoplanes auranticolor]
MGSAENIDIRPGTVADVPIVLGLLDKAVRWLVARGRPGQWGTEPLSARPQLHASTSDAARAGNLFLAYLGGQPVGALTVGDTPAYVPSAPEPELYVNLLVTDRDHPGHNVGGLLLDHARQLGRARGVVLLRVDCYAGDDQALIRYYERQGFQRVTPFEVARENAPAWPGQLLQDRLDDAPSRAAKTMT